MIRVWLRASAWILGLSCWALGETFYWHRNAVLTSSTDFNKAYNWTSNSDGTGYRPFSDNDDAFTADAIGSAWTIYDADAYTDTPNPYSSLTANADQLTIRGRGGDVWGATNQFVGAYRSDITGDFDVTVKVTSFDSTDVWGKAGIMMADNISTLTNGGFAMVAVTPGNGFTFQYDIATTVGQLEGETHTGTDAYPCWLRLVKSGTSVSAFYKTAIGNAWSQIGTAQTPQSTAANSEIALFSSSHTASATATVVFDDFRGGTNIATTGYDLSFNGSGSNADANATMSDEYTAASIDFTGYSGTFSMAGVNGLAGIYFDNQDFTGTVFSRLDTTVNFDWTTGSPDATIGANAFSARWEGWVIPQYSETYTFFATSDDGTRLWVNGSAVVTANWNDQAAHEDSGTVALTAGTAYFIRLEYYELSSTASCNLKWKSASQSKQVIPKSRLYAGRLEVTGNVTFTSTMTLTSTYGYLQLSGTGTQTLTPKSGATHPYITSTGSGTVSLSTNALTCLGFRNTAGRVDLNSLNITTASSGDFIVENGNLSTFADLAGVTLTVAGNADLRGSTASYLNLNPSSAWTLTVTGTLDATYASIKNSNASGGSTGTADTCVNQGGNSNWNFSSSSVDYSAWPYSQKIFFNTTTTGANVSGNVTDFPMLLRFTAANFLFSQTNSSGNDLRFSDPDGTPLPYEIERWDATNKKGEVWVRVPQVDGNSASDYITMYWGYTSATTASNDSLTFPSNDGYVGVWHLNTSGTGTRPNSATASYDLTTGGYDNDEFVQNGGIIGGADSLEGTNDYLYAASGMADWSNGLTFSVWAYPTASGSWARFMDFGNGGPSNNIVFARNGTGTTLTAEIWNGTTSGGYNSIVGGIVNNEWNHYAFTVNGTTVKVYRNGVLMKTNTSTQSIANITRASNYFGRSNWGDPYYMGKYDELRLSSSVRGDDFIKLSYETQKAAATVLTYQATALSNWAHGTRITINTSLTGANVMGDVADFSVPVKLTNSNFNFSQAQSDGSDLRFADSTGALLNYEIERFDATNKLAEIWVLLPTVQGNNKTQWFQMYWGKSNVYDLSSGSDVFSTSNSYAAVYHLGENGNTTASGYSDATANSYDGTGTAMDTTVDVEAQVGRGQTFNGSTQYISAGTTAGSGGSQTVSFWMKADALGLQIPVDKNPNDGSGVGWTFKLRTSTDSAVWYRIGSESAANDVIKNGAYTAGTWVHVTGTFDDASTGKLYLNGVLVASTTSATRNVSNSTTTLRLAIPSAASTAEKFDGTLDEVQISTAVRGADWVKLCYETQKSGSAAVTVGNPTSSYSHSVQLFFNTVGMGLSGNVSNIPILVRLSSTEVTFSATQDDGSDIKFVDKDGTQLFHEVVEWDKANSIGKVWVRVPQVDQSSTTDFINLYYGCSSCNNPYAQKDSVWSSFVSVFHLNAPEIKAYDAAGLENDGTYYQNMASSSGLTTKNAANFDGAADYVNVTHNSSYNITSNLSLWTWIYAGSWSGGDRRIIQKGNTDQQYRLTDASDVLRFEADGLSDDAMTITLPSTGTWHHVVATYDGANKKIYVDGSATTEAATGSIATSSDNLNIGFKPGSSTAGDHFDGLISEVRISGTSGALSADFIKLSYENQKSGSAFITTTPVTTASFTSSKVYRFNMGTTGANIKGDVFDFPLLIRITGSTMCDAVQSGAPDIRFLDADGVTWLDYSIERWNQTADSAEVWVKVPKIDGNSTNDYITLYYNDVTNGNVKDGQCTACVFDGSNITAVWHMNDSSGSSGTVADERGNYNGTLKRSGSSRNTSLNFSEGYIGKSSLSFSGTDEQVDIGSSSNIVRNVRGATLSAWVKATTLGTNNRDIIFLEKGSASGSRSKLTVTTNSFVGGGGRSIDADAVVTDTATTGALSTGTWYHLAAINDYASDSVHLYINGTRYTESRGASRFSQRATSNTSSNRTAIGSNADMTTEEWAGLIDEVQITASALDSNYVKLCYQTQRRDATPLFNALPSEFTSTQKYTFNTTKTGADIANDVENFPVLVRIAGSTIVDAVQNDYDDIRFMDADGATFLPYQVERWDKTADSAEVWVLVPKVDGNSDHDFITLYYNDVSNGAVADGQCATCVFDVNNDYKGVWHLDEETASTGTASVYKDATSNAYHGTDYIASTTRQGVVGRGHDFSVASTPDDYIDLTAASTLLPSASTTYTISLWFKADAINSSDLDHRMFQMARDGTSASAIALGLGSSDNVQFYTNGSATTYTSTGTVSTGTWTHAALSFDGTNFRLYINGALDMTQTATSYAGGSYVAKIGAQDNASLRAFDGHLDEVRLDHTARSADWIKLCYQNQLLTANRFWNTRAGPNNIATLASEQVSGGIQLTWPSDVSDSTAADSVAIWVKYTGYPDSANATGQTLVVRRPISSTDTTWLYPATFPLNYYFGLAVRNSSGAWSPITGLSRTSLQLGPSPYTDTVYVDSAIGSNSNSCTQATSPATPMATIVTALTCGSYASDTLVVRVLPGTYTDSNFSVTGSKPSVVESFDANSRPVLSGNGSTTENSTTYNYTVRLTGKMTLRRMRVRAATTGNIGVYSAYTHDDVTIDGNIIYNGASATHAEGIRTPDNGAERILIFNNVIHQPTSYGVNVVTDDRTNIVHNVFYGSGGSTKGVYMNKSAANDNSLTITNNIFYNWDYGIHTTDANNAVGTVSHNLFWQVTTGREVSGETDANKIVKDPLFASTAVLDPHGFKILSASPAREAGADSICTGTSSNCITTLPSVDMFGTSRPNGAVRDIGAYEGNGYAPTVASELDSLQVSSTASTVTVQTSKWKIVFDMALGGGIGEFYDMDASSTDLLAANKLLFDVTVGAYVASAQTSNTIAPTILRSSRTVAWVKQRLAVSASQDLVVLYMIHASGHIYVESRLENLTSGSLTVAGVEYKASVATATAASGNGGTNTGYGYLTTSTRDVAFMTTTPLDTGAASAETWAQTSASGASGYVKWNTSDLADIAANHVRTQSFLLYIGDESINANKTTTLHAEASAPLPIKIHAGSPLHERSWQDLMWGHWSLDDASGSTAKDNSVFLSHNGAITSATWINGKRGGALRFTTSAVVVVSDDDSLEARANQTISFWVNPDFSNMGTTAYFLSKGTSTSDGYFIRKVSGQSQITYTQGSGSVTVTLTANTWNFVTFVVTSRWQVYGYVNGILTAAGTTLATATANTSDLRFGENAGTGATDRFKGDLDDIRYYARELDPREILALKNQGMGNYDGAYRLRADNNNRVTVVLNDTATQTHVQPTFFIDNWYAGPTPAYVYLDGVRLTPLTDFVSDTLTKLYTTSGSKLVIQINKIITNSKADIFIDDDDSTGYLGESEKMPALSITATAADKIAIQNFSGTTFGDSSSKEWYLELDLDGWTTPTARTATETGFGEFNVWKTSKTSPSVAISSADQLAGQDGFSGRSVTHMKFDAAGTNDIFSGGVGYATGTDLTYTVVDSSATRLSLYLSNITYSGDVTMTVRKRYTIYPNGRIFTSFKISALSGTLDGPRVDWSTRYNTNVSQSWTDATAGTYARFAALGGDGDHHSIAGGLLSIYSASTPITTFTSMVSSGDDYTGNTDTTDVFRVRLNLQTTLFQAADIPITVNWVTDLSTDFTDSATADSLIKDVQTPATLTAITGTLTTYDSLDFNSDGFVEGEGCYAFTASSGGLAHFRFVNTVTHFNPAFKIKSWTFGTLPDFVLVNNQQQILGYHYNAYLNPTSNDLIIQFNRKFAPSTWAFFFSHKSGLAVTLNKLAARGDSGGNSVHWTTESEFENLGYHMWRRILIRPDSLTGTSLSDSLASPDEKAYSAEELSALGYTRVTRRMMSGSPDGRSSSTRHYSWTDRNAQFGIAYEYLLEAVDFQSRSTFFGPVKAAAAAGGFETALYGNYPNPFNPITFIRFSLRDATKVSLIIYDASGRIVRTLITPDRPMQPGRYRVTWNAMNDKGQIAATGPYFYRFKAGKFVKTKKMILLK